jgi:hypothetical protein
MIIVFNLVLAAPLGWVLGGLRGACLAVFIVAAVMAAPAALRRARTLWRRLAPVLLALGLPFAAIFMAIAVVLLWLANVISAWLAALGARPVGVVPVLRRLAAAGSVFRQFGTLVTPEELPWTLANIIMLLVLASAIEGITFALYVALLAVPTLLLGLIMLVLESDEPGE